MPVYSNFTPPFPTESFAGTSSKRKLPESGLEVTEPPKKIKTEPEEVTEFEDESKEDLQKRLKLPQKAKVVANVAPEAVRKEPVVAKTVANGNPEKAPEEVRQDPVVMESVVNGNSENAHRRVVKSSIYADISTRRTRKNPTATSHPPPTPSEVPEVVPVAPPSQQPPSFDDCLLKILRDDKSLKQPFTREELEGHLRDNCPFYSTLPDLFNLTVHPEVVYNLRTGDFLSKWYHTDMENSGTSGTSKSTEQEQNEESTEKEGEEMTVPMDLNTAPLVDAIKALLNSSEAPERLAQESEKESEAAPSQEPFPFDVFLLKVLREDQRLKQPFTRRDLENHIRENYPDSAPLPASLYLSNHPEIVLKGHMTFCTKWYQILETTGKKTTGTSETSKSTGQKQNEKSTEKEEDEITVIAHFKPSLPVNVKKDLSSSSKAQLPQKDTPAGTSGTTRLVRDLLPRGVTDFKQWMAKRCIKSPEMRMTLNEYPLVFSAICEVAKDLHHSFTAEEFKEKFCRFCNVNRFYKQFGFRDVDHFLMRFWEVSKTSRGKYNVATIPVGKRSKESPIVEEVVQKAAVTNLGSISAGEGSTKENAPAGCNDTVQLIAPQLPHGFSSYRQWIEERCRNSPGIRPNLEEKRLLLHMIREVAKDLAQPFKSYHFVEKFERAYTGNIVKFSRRLGYPDEPCFLADFEEVSKTKKGYRVQPIPLGNIYVGEGSQKENTVQERLPERQNGETVGLSKGSTVVPKDPLDSSETPAKKELEEGEIGDDETPAYPNEIGKEPISVKSTVQLETLEVVDSSVVVQPPNAVLVPCVPPATVKLTAEGKCFRKWIQNRCQKSSGQRPNAQEYHTLLIAIRRVAKDLPPNFRSCQFQKKFNAWNGGVNRIYRKFGFVNLKQFLLSFEGVFKTRIGFTLQPRGESHFVPKKYFVDKSALLKARNEENILLDFLRNLPKEPEKTKEALTLDTRNAEVAILKSLANESAALTNRPIDSSEIVDLEEDSTENGEIASDGESEIRILEDPIEKSTERGEIPPALTPVEAANECDSSDQEGYHSCDEGDCEILEESVAVACTALPQPVAVVDSPVVVQPPNAVLVSEAAPGPLRPEAMDSGQTKQSPSLATLQPQLLPAAIFHPKHAFFGQFVTSILDEAAGRGEDTDKLISQVMGILNNRKKA